MGFPRRRGEVNLRLGDAGRLFSAVGTRLLVQTARSSDELAPDPDLLSETDMAEELSIFVNAHGYVWRRFDALPFVVAGRLAALAQGCPCGR